MTEQQRKNDIARDAHPATGKGRGARIHRFDGHFNWSGVAPRAYKRPSDDWAQVVRHVLIGEREEETRFHLRYFEIGPQGFTSLETHEHAHVIIGLRGRGQVVAGSEAYELNFLDTLYIAPGTPHQLINEGDEPFGFFCLVDAERDQPRVLREGERKKTKTASAQPPGRDTLNPGAPGRELSGAPVERGTEE